MKIYQSFLAIVLLILMFTVFSCDKNPADSDDDNFWQKIGHENVNTLCLLVDQHGNIYSGTVDGIFRSTNNGDTWEKINNGLPLDPIIYDLVINSNNSIFALVKDQGIFRSDNNGASWVQINNGLPETDGTVYVQVNDLFGSSEYNVVYAGTVWNGVYNCQDGETWEPFNNGFEGGVGEVFRRAWSNKIFITTSHAIYVYSWTEDKWVKTELEDIGVGGLVANSSAYLAYSGARIFRSTDGINNWEELNKVADNSFIDAIFAAPNDDIFIGVGTQYNDAVSGVLRSIDNGNSWELIDNSGLPKKSLRIRSLIIDANKHLLIGTSAGLFRSVEPITSN